MIHVMLMYSLSRPQSSLGSTRHTEKSSEISEMVDYVSLCNDIYVCDWM